MENVWIKNGSRPQDSEASLVLGDPMNFLDKDHKYDIFFTS